MVVPPLVTDNNGGVSVVYRPSVGRENRYLVRIGKGMAAYKNMI